MWLKQLLKQGKTLVFDKLSLTNSAINFSLKLAKERGDELVADIHKSYLNSKELHLWKDCFYNLIEVFRKTKLAELKPHLIKFIDQVCA